ncbi:MAG: relaxase/mobilization nuclease domain-containing protein [Oscillospiraceae bacterium]|nr:relaxase/mobilization nuclease domain-containing protein [Oscillospiraceae bacterium]
MGILKIMTKPDADEMYLENVVNYIMHGHSIVSGGFNICPEYALEQMQIVKNYYGKQCRNQLVHFVISFNRNVWNIAYAEKLARKIAKYYADCYQILYAVHAEPRVNRRGEVANLLHVHMMMNSVSFVDGKNYADSRKENKKFAKHIAKITGDSRWSVCFGDEA